MTALRTATRFVNAPVSAPLSLSARRTSPSSKGIVANAVPSHDDHAHGGPDPSSRVGIPPVWGSAVGRGVSKTNVNGEFMEAQASPSTERITPELVPRPQHSSSPGQLYALAQWVEDLVTTDARGRDELDLLWCI